MTHNWKIKKQKFCLQSKNFPPDKRHPGHRSRYGKYGPRSGYGFLRTACQPIRIENFEKPYNNMHYLQLGSFTNVGLLSLQESSSFSSTACRIP